jgi:hypothetical protein
MISFSEQPGGGPQRERTPKAKPAASGASANDFAVSAGGGTIRIMNPPTRPITPREALNLAAWLLVLARSVDGSLTEKDFRLLAEQIENS